MSFVDDTDPLGTLARYAGTPNPETIPAAVLRRFTEKTVTVVDAYPKAKYHWLVLPRPCVGLTMADLANLRTLMRGDKERAKKVLEELGEEAEVAKAKIEEKMMEEHGFKWEVWTGFHAIPSMRHIHMHVISSDLISEALKTKKHYDSFHPRHGYFLHFKDVMEWFDAVPEYYDRMTNFRPSQYANILKEDLFCWQCDKAPKNMPMLKAHLEEHFAEEKKRGVEREQRRREQLERKRKRQEAAAKKSADSGDKATASTSASADAAKAMKGSSTEAHDVSSPPRKRQETEGSDDR